MVKELDEGLMKIGRTLAGGHVPSIAKAAFAHAGIRNELLLKVMDVVNEEVDTLCQKQTNPDNPSTFSLYSSKINSLEEFNFNKCTNELEDKCPILQKLLLSIVQRNDHCKKATFLLFYILPEFRRYSDACNQQADGHYYNACTFTFAGVHLT